MGHAVYHRTASGEAQLEDVSSLEAALELVERLRNEDGPKDVRVFKEIPVEVRTYYRVVAAEDGETTSETKQTTAEVVSEPPAVEQTSEFDEVLTTADAEVADESPQPGVVEDEASAPSASSLTEPPAGAMPLLSPPPPSVTVHADDNDDEPAAAASNSGRSKLFNRG